MYCRLTRAKFLFPLILATALLMQPVTVAAQGKTQKISKKLIDRAEDMIKEIDKTKKQVDNTVKKYDSVFSKKKVKDRQNAYKDLSKEIKKTEDRVKEARKRSDDMGKEADKFFSEWSKGLTSIEDTELRSLSQATMTETRDRYGKIIESGATANGLYESFLTDLKNQSSYLELDMSDGGMEKLKPSQAETKAKASGLSSSIKDLVTATKGYISSMK